MSSHTMPSHSTYACIIHCLENAIGCHFLFECSNKFACCHLESSPAKESRASSQGQVFIERCHGEWSLHPGRTNAGVWMEEIGQKVQGREAVYSLSRHRGKINFCGAGGGSFMSCPCLQGQVGRGRGAFLGLMQALRGWRRCRAEVSVGIAAVGMSCHTTGGRACIACAHSDITFGSK